MDELFTFVQLNTKTLETVLASDMDTIKKNVHLGPQNRSGLLALSELGEVTGTLSRSGPLMGSGMVHLVSLDEGDTGHQTVWQPDKGQIWQISTLSVKPTGGGTVNCSVSLEDSTTAARVVVDTGATGTGAVVVDIVNGPLLISNECFLSFYFSSQGTTGSDITIGAFRVR